MINVWITAFFYIFVVYFSIKGPKSLYMQTLFLFCFVFRHIYANCG